jgi:hypothetical protein
MNLYFTKGAVLFSYFNDHLIPINLILSFLHQVEEYLQIYLKVIQHLV